ncbi:unnamed protein product [Penicillium glandicola]
MNNCWILVRNGKGVTKMAADNIKFTGYDINELESSWFVAVHKFFAPGGGAEQKLGPIASADLLYRNDNPIHQSEYNRNDTRDILTFMVTPVSGNEKMCHVFRNGRGTSCMNDREQ